MGSVRMLEARRVSEGPPSLTNASGFHVRPTSSSAGASIMQPDLETAKLADAQKRPPWWPFALSSLMLAGGIYSGGDWDTNRRDDALFRWETFHIAQSLAAGD